MAHVIMANNAKQDGLESSYKLKDTASFLDDLLTSITKGVNGEDRNPYWLVVAVMVQENHI